MALILSALAFLFSLFSFFFLKSYLKRRTNKEHILSEARDEVDQISKIINQATERDISLIEERQQDLKNLLKETEKRISVYIKEVERTQKAEEVHIKLNSEKKKKSSAEEYKELGKNRYKIKEQPDLPLDADEQPKEPSDKALNEQIISLLHSGFSVPLIASSLKISIAEVEMRISNEV